MGIHHLFFPPSPPSYVTDKERWRKIVHLRMRSEYWWAASIVLKVVGWALAIGTVFVASIAASKPSLVYANWTTQASGNWSWAVVFMSALSGLIQWRKIGRVYEYAHDILDDAITLYDADEEVTVKDVIDASNTGRKLLQAEEKKPDKP